MSEPDSPDVTRLLADCRAGDPAALDRLLPLLYDELRSLAKSYLGRERGGHTLEPTALVHEAFLKLVGERERNWRNRSHFFALAAQAMRRVLMNHAEKKKSAKRGGGARRVTLFEAASLFEEDAADLLALDEALRRLAAFDEAKSRLVELRFFGGLTTEETASVLGVSARTVERDWRLARAWLRKEVEGAT